MSKTTPFDSTLESGIAILYNDDPTMPMGLRKELSIIQEALLKIDFQINDDDKCDFYTWSLNELYNIKGDFANPDFVPKKYFKVLLKEIKNAINWSPHTDN
jgi:hypothetical protein